MEAMQDVFVELVRREDRLVVASPSSFLYRTATNVCLNRIRTHKRKPSTPQGELLELIAEAPIAEDRSLARQANDLALFDDPDGSVRMGGDTGGKETHRELLRGASVPPQAGDA